MVPGPAAGATTAALTRRESVAALVEVVGAPHEARFIVEEALGGRTSPGRPDRREGPLSRQAVASARAMAARRAAGEPLQYVFGHWSFRSLDLVVDRRVLIPRPETEQVVEVALREARRLHDAAAAVSGPAGGLVAVDVGTGTGAIALSLATELGAGVLAGVWAVDASADALAVAGANLDEVLAREHPRPLPPVTLLEGDWLSPLPAGLRGAVGLVVSNPPYVSEAEWVALDAGVRAEPRRALVSGPGRDGTPGLAGVEAVLVGSPAWLTRPGAVVVELAPHQAGAAVELARGLGYADVRVEPDLAGRSRTLVARLAARTMSAEHENRELPRLVGPHEGPALADALDAGRLVALPWVGGYCLAAREDIPAAEARLAALVADPEGPHFAVGEVDAAQRLTSGWTDELDKLLQRVWPGPLEVFVSRAGHPPGEDRDGAGTAGWAAVLGMPESRAVRRLCREHGPWRIVPLVIDDAREVAQAFDAADVPLVVDGGRREGPRPTLVDATVKPMRVLREGALPAHFVEGAMAMANRRLRLFRRR